MWSQTNTQAARFQHTLKCKRELSCLKPFPDGPGGVSEWSSPAKPARLSITVVATGWRWVADKRHPLCLERDASCTRSVCICQTPTRNQGNLWKGQCAQLRCGPTQRPPACLYWFHFPTAAAHSCLGDGSGPGEAAAGGGSGIWHVFLIWTFLP